ncbi:MAG: hypothetical protein H6825_16720 [Planctomycetes bacterium]|nr:hypothetical protein [Planctomycetota bacterium]
MTADENTAGRNGHPLPERDEAGDGASEALRAALEAARLAGAAVRAIRGRPGLGASLPLEEARRVVETVVREHLRAERGDEADDDPLLGGPLPRWRIAPLEGARSLIAGLPHVATVIAFERDGLPELAVIHAPLMGSDPSAAGARTREARRERDAGAAGDQSRSDDASRPDARSGRHARDDRSRRTRGDVHPTADLVDRLDDFAGRTWYALRGSGAFVLDGTRTDVPSRRLPPQAAPPGSARRPRRANSWWDHVLLAEGRADLQLPSPAGHHGAAALALRLLVEEALGPQDQDPAHG